ncbi:MAG: response regulator transcription factor [Thermodesulfobacteriota bacterium]|nr:response regulator transcription factor [Thermodesulfobacteriota bacterium]
MSKEKILIVDDEKDIVELVAYHLGKEGFRMILSFDGEDAVRLAQRESPDLVILDLMLPGLDGLEVCRLLKRNQETQHIPIIMLTAKAQETDIVVGLELGADDYVTKPFSPRELIARVNAVLRRVTQIENIQETLMMRDLIIDLAQYQATWKGNPLDLTTTEFKLLLFLVQRQGMVMTRQQILDGVLGDDAFVTERTVDVHIRRLRKKLGEAFPYIITKRGIGYMFQGNSFE